MRKDPGNKNRIAGKKGSSSVFLALVFLAFAICIVSCVGVCRNLVIGSECEAFGRVWTRAILSEYDRHLLEDYGIMAYWGNETEVQKKINAYIEYSAEGKLDADFGNVSSELAGYELGDPDNFRKAVEKSFAGNAAKQLIKGTGRQQRRVIGETEGESDSSETNSDSPGNRRIGNTVVLDTLPSAGTSGGANIDSVSERAKSLGNSDSVESAILGAGTMTAFIWQHFGSYISVADGKDSYFRNELEYIISGKSSDAENLKSCRNKLFILRNALNLAALYRDPSKVELIASAAELITPGPLGAVTQVVIAEAWAAAETKKDIDVLYEGNRVPVLKNSDQWMTDIESVINSDEVKNKLDQESRQLMEENQEELRQISGTERAASVITEGLDYDEYLMIMIMAVKEQVKILRAMDLVQINMKFRYYRDFNLMEYYTGTSFTIRAEGKDHTFEDSYK